MDSSQRVAKLKVKVVPGASKSEITGWLGDALKVRVAAQPEKGKANAAVAAILARRLGLPTKNVRVIAGKSSPQKVFEIQGFSIAQVQRTLGFKGAV